MIAPPSRVSAKQYAQSIGKHEDTVQAWCRNAALLPKDRNPDLPAMKAIKRGRDWAIDVEATELAQSLQGGTVLEQEAAKRAIKEAAAERELAKRR